MVIGHESAGTVAALGAGVTSLAVGDRVAMEPGARCPRGRAGAGGPCRPSEGSWLRVWHADLRIV